MELVVTAICPDLSLLCESSLMDCLAQFPDSDVIVFPEYLLELQPFIRAASKKQLIIWGSKQYQGRNTLFVSVDGEEKTFSKLKLTPWEKTLEAGSQLPIIHYRGIKIALLICFDVEFPCLAQQLKNEQIDLLIVPSATEDELGYERVNRCASARSVELGCAVVTCHLVGTTKLALLDENVGNHNLFLPSQSLFSGLNRNEIKPVKEAGGLSHTYSISIDKILDQRQKVNESNPSLLM